MSAKDRLAATMLNHWYCVSRAEEIGLIKVKPKPSSYREKLNDFDKLDDQQIKKVISHFQSANHRTFLGILGRILKDVADFDDKLKTKSIQISVKMKIALDDYTKFSGLIRAPGQLQEIVDALNLLPPPKPSDDGKAISLPLDVRAGGADFFDNLFMTEKMVYGYLRAVQQISSLIDFIKENLTKDQLSEALSGQLFVVFSSARFEDVDSITTDPMSVGLKVDPGAQIKQKKCCITAAKFELVETPSAKASREMKQRLEDALRKRIKKVRDLAIDARSITYNFEETTIPPLKLKLELITDW